MAYKDKQKTLEVFVNEYNRIKPVSGHDFNNRKAEGVCCWLTAARMLGYVNWTDLRRELCLTDYNKKDADLLREQFIKEAVRITPTSGYDYDTRKDKSLPIWKTVATAMGLNKWTELVAATGIMTYDEYRKAKSTHKLIVSSVVLSEELIKAIDEKYS